MNRTTLTLIAAILCAAAMVATAAPLADTLGQAIVVQDPSSLRAAPRDSAQQQTLLWQGEVLEVRGERLDYLQVWDHKRERGGFVRASEVRRVQLTESESPALLSVLRFVRDTPGAEALGIGLTAAYLQAAPAGALAGEPGAQALDALGTLADRLARRASAATPGKTSAAALSAHLDVASGYGVRFTTYERDGRMQVCYDGEAFRRVLALPKADADQRARAALALTRPECTDPDLPAHERARLQEEQAQLLDRVEVAGLPSYLRNRVQMRRAGLWGGIAFQQARKADGATASTAAAAAASRALAEFAGVSRNDLTDDDQSAYNDAAMRVSAVRWALVPPPVATDSKRPSVVLQPGAPGETCVLLVDARHGPQEPLARRCTYGVVWTASASLNREGNALALAVQPLEGWRELWVMRKTAAAQWVVDVLPPTAATPETGYAEWAGWVPGGQQMLVAREARGSGRWRRSFEVVRIDGLSTERVTGDVAALPLFQRWQDAGWKRQTLSLR